MQPTLLWQRLQQQLQQQIDLFPGVAGIAVKDLTDGNTISLNADEIFPTASTIKIQILLQLLVRAAAGEVDLEQRIVVDPAQLVLGSGVLSYLDGPVELTLRNIANLMIMVSDNTATNICLEQAGLEATNQLLRQLNLTQTVVRRKMMDHLAAVREQENVSTPGELVAILEALYNGKPDPSVAEACLTILKKPKQGFIDKALPENIACANKPGWVDRAMCDAGLVYLPRRPYILAIMTKHGMCDKLEQEAFIVNCTRIIHETMASLDRSNQFGRSVYE
ncbi:MAG: serine hydrolase [Caldilineaceae bacterium]